MRMHACERSSHACVSASEPAHTCGMGSRLDAASSGRAMRCSRAAVSSGRSRTTADSPKNMLPTGTMRSQASRSDMRHASTPPMRSWIGVACCSASSVSICMAERCVGAGVGPGVGGVAALGFRVVHAK
eukprot:204704-Chlamydomonas_euryale.AAC.1